MTSYGPVTSSAVVTPGKPAISDATAAALPTSVWMRMYAWTTACPFVFMGQVGVRAPNNIMLGALGPEPMPYPLAPEAVNVPRIGIIMESERSLQEVMVRPEPPTAPETVASVGE